MGLCLKCGINSRAGVYTSKNLFVCNDCKHEVEVYLYDEFKIVDGEVKIISPFSVYSIEDQRAKCIEIAYTIFNNKLNKSAYPLLKKWTDSGKYTWLGIARSLEWFYVLQKNSTDKANNSVGIVPYIYEKAQDYYNNESLYRKRKWEHYSNMERQKEKEAEEIKVTTKKNIHKIDMDLL